MNSNFEETALWVSAPSGWVHEEVKNCIFIDTIGLFVDPKTGRAFNGELLEDGMHGVPFANSYWLVVAA